MLENISTNLISDSNALKIAITGDGAVGKTSLCKKLTQGCIPGSYDLTIGCEIHSQKLTLSSVNKTFSLVLWDLAGQERFESISDIFYKGTRGALVVFDLTSRGSFYDLSNWIRELRHSAPDVPFILVGNKADKKEREVSRQEAEEFAKSYGASYFETSAENGVNVETVFQQVTRLALQHDKKPVAY